MKGELSSRRGPKLTSVRPLSVDARCTLLRSLISTTTGVWTTAYSTDTL
jgi:hypothetical protein